MDKICKNCIYWVEESLYSDRGMCVNEDIFDKVFSISDDDVELKSIETHKNFGCVLFSDEDD